MKFSSLVMAFFVQGVSAQSTTIAVDCQEAQNRLITRISETLGRNGFALDEAKIRGIVVNGVVDTNSTAAEEQAYEFLWGPVAAKRRKTTTWWTGFWVSPSNPDYASEMRRLRAEVAKVDGYIDSDLGIFSFMQAEVDAIDACPSDEQLFWTAHSKLFTRVGLNLMKKMDKPFVAVVVGNKVTREKGCTERCFEDSHFFTEEMALLDAAGAGKNLVIDALNRNCGDYLKSLQATYKNVNPAACGRSASRHDLRKAPEDVIV